MHPSSYLRAHSMPNTLRTVSQFRIGGRRAETVLQELVKIPRFAHHPTCRCYDNHLLRVGELNLCLGCTSLWSGAVLAASTATAFCCWRGFYASMAYAWQFIGIGVLLYLPTIVQIFWQYKPFKVVSRALLGVSIALLWFGAILLLPFSSWGGLLRCIFLVTFYVVFTLTQKLRNRFSRSPCESCDHGRYPFCSDNLERVRRVLGSDGDIAMMIPSLLPGSPVPEDVQYEVLWVASGPGWLSDPAHNHVNRLVTPFPGLTNEPRTTP